MSSGLRQVVVRSAIAKCRRRVTMLLPRNRLVCESHAVESSLESPGEMSSQVASQYNIMTIPRCSRHSAFYYSAFY